MKGISSLRKSCLGLPALAASRSAISSAFSSIASAILSIASARSLGVVVDHPSNAFLAAATALFTSCLDEIGPFAMTSPVAGFITSSALPPEAATNLPLIMFLSLSGAADFLLPLLLAAGFFLVVAI